MGLLIKLQTAVTAGLGHGLLVLILGKRLELEEKQSFMMKKVTDLLAGTKTSGLLFNKNTEI